MAGELECIGVTCPKCGSDYATWLGVGLESLGPDPCPCCGFTPAEDPRLHRDRPPVEPDDEEA
ncbi:MAG: hypothetical protein MUC56_03185 [Thermoanaerobaculales bacterium]|jgi:hypothetical protein|nr:hypothetical protein [Thermoanaerobaculales bacterium]